MCLFCICKYHRMGYVQFPRVAMRVACLVILASVNAVETHLDSWRLRTTALGNRACYICSTTIELFAPFRDGPLFRRALQFRHVLQACIFAGWTDKVLVAFKSCLLSPSTNPSFSLRRHWAHFVQLFRFGFRWFCDDHATFLGVR